MLVEGLLPAELDEGCFAVVDDKKTAGAVCRWWRSMLQKTTQQLVVPLDPRLKREVRRGACGHDGAGPLGQNAQKADGEGPGRPPEMKAGSDPVPQRVERHHFTAAVQARLALPEA